MQLRGQRESANEEKQRGCQGRPGAGQTQWLRVGGQWRQRVKGQHQGQEQALTSEKREDDFFLSRRAVRLKITYQRE